MKQAVQRALKAGAQGCMIRCGGRLAGAEMARVETVREGQVPRHTLRAEIDYAKGEALTTFGRIGIKVGSTRARSCRVPSDFDCGHRTLWRLRISDSQYRVQDKRHLQSW